MEVVRRILAMGFAEDKNAGGSTISSIFENPDSDWRCCVLSFPFTCFGVAIKVTVTDVVSAGRLFAYCRPFNVRQPNDKWLK